MLKRIRITVSVLVLSLLVLVYVGMFQTHPAIVETALFFQFVPSAVDFFLGDGGILSPGSFGCLAVLFLTIVFGRFYCGALCPLGILQDLILTAKQKVLRRKTRFSYFGSYKILHYSLLALVVLSTLSGSLLLLNLLDPFGLFGRIATDVIRPLVVLGRNFIVVSLERFDIFSGWSMNLHTVSLPVFFITIGFAAALVLLTLTGGRRYCNTICPVGAFLGILSKISFFRISNSPENCNGCGICETVCRAECIDSSRKYIDASRCTMCGDCLTICPSAALSFRARKKFETPKHSASRRKFLAASVGSTCAAAFAGLTLRNPLQAAIHHGSTTPITPPGSKSSSHFSSRCISCHLCVSACPSKIIEPALLEYGLSGIGQPHLRFERGYCEYECNLCSQICPTGAISPLPLELKKRTQIGRAKFIEERCVVHNKGKDCGACAEVCPTDAVKMEFRDSLFFPKTDPERCIGCGHCEHACPTSPKAIYVEACAVHKTAKPPFQDADTFIPQGAEDEPFPF